MKLGGELSAAERHARLAAARRGIRHVIYDGRRVRLGADDARAILCQRVMRHAPAVGDWRVDGAYGVMVGFKRNRPPGCRAKARAFLSVRDGPHHDEITADPAAATAIDRLERRGIVICAAS
jgi:hypothetical protein